MKLVNNAKDAWRWFSVQSMVIAAALQGGWIMVPGDLRDNVPSWVATSVTIGILALGVIGRLVDQGGDDVKQEDTA